METGECLRTFVGHERRVRSVDVSSDGETIVSGSMDTTLKVWCLDQDQCLRTLQPSRPYEGMRIRGVTGVTDAQVESLKALGATS